jgi:hypothetical protein
MKLYLRHCLFSVSEQLYTCRQCHSFIFSIYNLGLMLPTTWLYCSTYTSTRTSVITSHTSDVLHPHGCNVTTWFSHHATRFIYAAYINPNGIFDRCSNSCLTAPLSFLLSILVHLLVDRVIIRSVSLIGLLFLWRTNPVYLLQMQLAALFFFSSLPIFLAVQFFYWCYYCPSCSLCIFCQF